MELVRGSKEAIVGGRKVTNIPGPPQPPQFRLQPMQECYWCTALVPVRALRCAHCRGDLINGPLHSAAHLPSQRAFRRMESLERSWRRARQAAAFLFGIAGTFALGMCGAHLAEVAGQTVKLNLPFAIVTGAAGTICALLVIIVKPGKEKQ